jgi:hypothetical protein
MNLLRNRISLAVFGATGPNRLPPLAEYTVTETVVPQARPTVDLWTWAIAHGILPVFNATYRRVCVAAKEPDDVQPVLTDDDIERGWVIEWDG